MIKVIQPTKRLLRSGLSTLWTILRNGWRLLVWEDVRAGTINLSGMPRSFRMLMRLGMWLTVILLISMIFSDGWRVISPLQPLTFYNDLLAGLYVPELLIPVVFGLLAIAWAYLLTGALHAPWFAKLLVLLLFGLFDYGLMLTPLSFFLGEIELLLSGFDLAQIGLWNTLAVLATGVGWLFLIVVFLVRWKRPVHPGLEFPLISTGTVLLLFSAHFGAQFGSVGTQTQAVVTGLQLTTALEQIATLLNPFLVIAGVEIVLFGMALTRLVLVPLGQRAGLRTGKGRLWWIMGLGAFLLFRLWQDWLAPLWNGTNVNFSWGVVIIGIVLLPVFFWAYQSRPRGSLPVWVIPAAAVLLFAILFVFQIGYLILATIGIGFILLGSVTMGNALVESVSRVFDVVAEWNGIWVSLFALLVGLGLWLRARLKRQPIPPASLYTFIFVLWFVWWTLTRTDRPLESFYFSYVHIPVVATLFISGIFLGALVMRRLSPRILLMITAASVLFWLLGSRELLDDPFSPLFVWLGAQTALISLSIFLNVMNAGNRFALNVENEHWSRMTRGLLYFGYALLTVISMLWLVAGHQTEALATNDLLVNSGYGVIGIPLALWVLMVGGEEVFASIK